MSKGEVRWWNSDSCLVVAFFALHVGVLLLWWAAFSPAIMSPDSLSQWTQAQQMRLNDWHPYISTLYLALFLHLFHTPAAVAFFQMFVTAFFFSYVFLFFLRNGVSRKVVFFAYLLLLVSIPVGVYSMTMWKDIPFSLAIVAVGFFLAKAKYQNSQPLSKKELATFCAACVVATTFRHNGILNLVVVPSLLFFFFSGEKWARIFSGYFLAISITILFVIPHFFPIQPKPFWMTATKLFAYHMTAGIYHYAPATYMTPQLVQIFERVNDDTQNLKASYSPLYWNALFWNEHIKKEVVNDPYFWEDLTREFYSRNFLPNILFIAKQKAIAFLTVSNGMGYDHAVILSDNGHAIPIEKNELGLEGKAASPSLNKILGGVLFSMPENGLAEGITWNAFIPLALLAVVFVLSLSPRRSEKQVYSLFVLLQIPLLVVFNVAGDWRYYYFCYLSLFVTIPFFFLPPAKDFSRAANDDA